MLRFVKECGDIDYVILDKVDRFARNRRDDANTLFELRSVGTQLVSVKENIDETAGRTVAARHHGGDRGVLQPQPGERGH
jgi:DNA invertase Pin-like site-specific DNA recombinase